MKRIAINGLGRVGRLLLRHYYQRQPFNHFNIVAVNEPMPADNLVYLLKYDSVHGQPGYSVAIDSTQLKMGDWSIPIFHQTDAKCLPWQSLDIDLVIDCSGHFTRREKAAQHLEAGAGRVLIGAPCPEADTTLVLGVNEQDYNPQHHRIISNASCTTNSLAPILKILDQQWGIEAATVTTIHAYTASQVVVDTAATRMHRGRAASLNIIPTSSGADTATTLVLPQLKDRINTLAVRVPVANGSLTDLSAELRTKTHAKQINQVFADAAEGTLKDIIQYSDEELVSSDIIGNPHSAIVHGRSTRLLRGTLLKMQLWYDNEFGYACRCLDLAEKLYSKPDEFT